MYGYRLGAIGIVITFFGIIFSTVLMPMVLFNPKASGRENNYTSQRDGDAARGRQIYVREGCFYCHTQFNRLQDRGYGPLVKAGDYINETPHQLGTARTGPDLTNEGGRFPPQWQKAHLVEPRAVKPGSIMPSFSYLSDRDMNDLVAYIETLGNERKPEHFVEAPDEYRTTTETGRKLLALKAVDTNASASANAGRGIYQQNCASCHGMQGLGEGPNAISLEKKPPNFSRPFYKQYSDEFWFYRITEGVPGTRMPKWGDGGGLGDPRGGILTQEQRWYLVAYLKTLPRDQEVTIDNLDQLNKAPQVKLPTLTHQEYEPATGGGE
ncbi:MAG TPA: cbb3-type cytochrome c oxidase subunit II [Planktothrix sp.]|jgi:cbb3-type cytochrome oxidase cytochrome c subunit